MPTTTDLGIPQGGLLHVFNTLENRPASSCELCRQEQATFQWTKRHDDRVLKQGIPVCRTCAGMIVLVGKEDYREADFF